MVTYRDIHGDMFASFDKETQIQEKATHDALRLMLMDLTGLFSI